MWITGGTAKGTRLKTLPKRSIRPTTGVVKQAIFSLLQNTSTEWDRVLDLYAGTGALGIEALSRGAEWVDFVEQRKACCDIIRTNLERIGALHRAHVYCCRVSKAITFLNGAYDVVLLDPPFADPSISSLLADLATSGLLAEGSTAVLCHANRFPMAPQYDGLQLVQQRRHGDTFIFIYRKEKLL